MTVLILDTSSDKLYIGLLSDTTLLSWKEVPHHNQLSNFILTSIETLLQEHQISLSELTRIACGIGPGSFTGTRIGAMVGQTLAFALEIPVIGFPSALLNGDRTLLVQTLQENGKKESTPLEIHYFNCSLSSDSSKIRAPEP